MAIDVSEMVSADHDEVMALWRRCEGIGLSESDSGPRIATFLARNPGMSAVARAADGSVVGAVLCGDDGRRGYLHHLAVSPDARRIEKCNIFLFDDNADGAAFWLHAGWRPRDDLRVLQKLVGS